MMNQYVSEAEFGVALHDVYLSEIDKISKANGLYASLSSQGAASEEQCRLECHIFWIHVIGAYVMFAFNAENFDRHSMYAGFIERVQGNPYYANRWEAIYTRLKSYQPTLERLGKGEQVFRVMANVFGAALGIPVDTRLELAIASQFTTIGKYFHDILVRMVVVSKA
jgi:hypothetical protein